MPHMKIWNGSAWIPLDAADADTVDGKHASDFAPATHVGQGGAAHALATSSSHGFMSSSDKAKLDGIQAGAEVNQNAFSNIKVGATTISADSKTDTLEITGTRGVILTPDAVNDKLTIGVNQTVISDIEPTTELYDGLIWYAPSINQTRIYLNGAFRKIASGSSDENSPFPLKRIDQTIVTSTNTTTVSHQINGFDSFRHILLVFKNSVFLQEGTDYILTVDGTGIQSLTGEWEPSTFDFVALMSEKATFTQLRNTVIVDTPTSSVYHNLPNYDPSAYILFVFQNSVFLQQNVDYQLSADGMSVINLAGEWEVDTQLDFVAIKAQALPTKPTTITLTARLVEESYIYQATGGETEVNIPFIHNPSRDVLMVYQDGRRLRRGTHWNYSADNMKVIFSSALKANAEIELVAIKIQ